MHQVTLADGHRAWLIVRHAEAKAALNHAGLSKDMQAALARDGAVVAEGLPGPAFARHMLSVDPPDHTRLRRLTSAAFSRPRIAALRPRVQAIVDGLLDDLQARGDVVVDLVKGFAFPLPFTVISELLGVPEPDRDQLGGWFTTLLAPSTSPDPVRRRAGTARPVRTAGHPQSVREARCQRAGYGEGDCSPARRLPVTTRGARLTDHGQVRVREHAWMDRPDTAPGSVIEEWTNT